MRKAVLGWGFAGLIVMAGAASAQIAGPKISEAGPNDLRILAVNSIRVPLEQGLPEAEKLTGRHIVIQTGTASGNLHDIIMSGQDFEIALLVPDVNAQLIKDGKVAPGETLIATGTMGFGLHGNNATVDVSSPDAIRKTLLGAKWVIFSPQSSGLPAVQKMLGDLKIADTIKHKNSGNPPETFAPGEYEVYLYPMSEIVINKEWKNLGLFPSQWQVPVKVTAVTGLHPRDAAATKQLMDYLTGPAMTAIFAKNAWMR